ncbi:hypothetical protein EV567_3096 [Streptomyces sp. BK239]|nr:hypothetical protein EV567_3096 [Streptomyces sp. BK239]
MPEPRPVSLPFPALAGGPTLVGDSRSLAQRRGNRRPFFQASATPVRRVPPPARNLPRRYGN